MRERQTWAAWIALAAAAAIAVPDATFGWVTAAAFTGAAAVLAPRDVARRMAPLALVLVAVAITAVLGAYGVP